MMEDLIARLIAADGADHGLDAEIYAKVARRDLAGTKTETTLGGGVEFFESGGDGRGWHFAPRYTESLDAVMTLEHPDWQISSGNCNEDNAPWACVTTPDNVDHTGDGAATEILARLIALLKARIQP